MATSDNRRLLIRSVVDGSQWIQYCVVELGQTDNVPYEGLAGRRRLRSATESVSRPENSNCAPPQGSSTTRTFQASGSAVAWTVMVGSSSSSVEDDRGLVGLFEIPVGECR